MAPKGLQKAAAAPGQRTLYSTWSATRAPSAAPQQRTTSKKRAAEDEPVVLSSDNEEPTPGESNKKRKASNEPNTLQALWSSQQLFPPVPQQTFPKKRRAGDKPATPASNPGGLSQPVPQLKKGKAKQPVVPLSDSEGSGSDSEDPGSEYDDDVDASDDSDGEDDNDHRSAEEIEEAQRAKLLLTLESQDTLTVDQAMILEPRETHTFEDDYAPEPVLENIHAAVEPGKSSAESSSDRQEFILKHLTSQVREGLHDKLSAFVEATLPSRTPAQRAPVPWSVLVPKQRRSEWVFEDPKLAEIWSRMVGRLVEEAERTGYASFDPAMLVAPIGNLNAPILLGLHWPPWSEDLPEYPNIRDMIRNPCIRWLDKQFGLQDTLTFDFRPLAFRKTKNYSERPPWHDMPASMVDIIDEALREIMEASTAKAAVYFGKHDYDIYRKLYPNSEPLKLSTVPIYGRKFVHACVEYVEDESGQNTDDIRRVVVFPFHPESGLRGLHPVHAKLMDNLCNLASMIAKRSRVRRDMYMSVAKLNIKQRPNKLASVDFKRSKVEFHMTCKAYAKEVNSGLLYTRESLPQRLVGLLDPNLEVHTWRRYMVLDGRYEPLNVDDDTDQSIRKALRAAVADAKPKNSPSLVGQAICKLLEEPAMFYRGKYQGRGTVTQQVRHLVQKQRKAAAAGKEIEKLIKAASAAYKGLMGIPRREARLRPGHGQQAFYQKSLAVLEDANMGILNKQLNGPNPQHAYDPESRLAALYLVGLLPKDRNTIDFNGSKTTMQTSFGAEMRNLRTLWKKNTSRVAFMNYVMPKIKAHGLEDRVPGMWKKFL